MRKEEDAHRAGESGRKRSRRFREAIELIPLKTSGKALQVILIEQGEDDESGQAGRSGCDAF